MIARANGCSEGMPRRSKARRWNIKPEHSDASMTRLAMILKNRNSSPAEICKATRLLLAMEAQNQKDEHHKKKRVSNKCVAGVHRGWYGNEVYDDAPESAASADGGGAVGGEKEDDAERQETEQDAAGANGFSPGCAAGERDSCKASAPPCSSSSRTKRRRWNIKPEYRDLAMLRLALIVANPESRTADIFSAIRLQLTAEAQNQKDENCKKGRRPKQLVIGIDRGFYGNKADTLSAQRAAASNSGADVSGAKKDRDLRPEVGQDSAGSAGLPAGPRSGGGPPSGSD